MRLVRAILIDPFACVITEVRHNADDYREIYGFLSHESMKVTTFTAVYLPNGDAVFVDDEGLLKPCDRFFHLIDYHEVLAGKGLILGANAQGETVDCNSDIEAISESALFLRREPDAVAALTQDRFVRGLRNTTTPWKRENMQ